MFFYNLTIYLYALVVYLISPFHTKARKMIVGQRETFAKLKREIDPKAHYIWVHAASLGEFEQGRPIIEEIRKKHPEYKILLTFFSPSGYDVCKDYPLVDTVCYLPFDKKHKVKKFLQLAQPQIAIFIKYEFWCNYVKQLHQRAIPCYMVSAVFRPEQVFFRWYGFPMRKILPLYTCICVQDDNSEKLLHTIDINNVAVCGDTRFDRVHAIQSQVQQLEILDLFAQKAKQEKEKILVAGSSWPKDEDILIPFFNLSIDLKLVIAPHEIDEAHLKYIESELARPHIRYSQATAVNIGEYDCLIIDSFGLLSSIYRYAQIAYVGGGFGVGIHNILEAAVYAVPVVFGPNFKKFREAQDLIEQGGAYAVSDYPSFRGLMDEFVEYEETLASAGRKAQAYVQSNTGVVQGIMRILKL